MFFEVYFPASLIERTDLFVRTQHAVTLALARLACQAAAEAPHAHELRAVDALVARAQTAVGAEDRYAITVPAMTAQFLAGTASLIGS